MNSQPESTSCTLNIQSSARIKRNLTIIAVVDVMICIKISLLPNALNT